jgi:hypothetical protein
MTISSKRDNGVRSLDVSCWNFVAASRYHHVKAGPDLEPAFRAQGRLRLSADRWADDVAVPMLGRAGISMLANRSAKHLASPCVSLAASGWPHQ